MLRYSVTKSLRGDNDVRTRREPRVVQIVQLTGSLVGEASRGNTPVRLQQHPLLAVLLFNDLTLSG